MKGMNGNGEKLIYVYREKKVSVGNPFYEKDIHK